MSPAEARLWFDVLGTVAVSSPLWVTALYYLIKR